MKHAWHFLLLGGLVCCTVQSTTSTAGHQNNARFSYTACLFGCAVDQPMMLGTEETIQVDGAIPPNATVTSTSPSVMSVKSFSRVCCSKGSDGSTTCRTAQSLDVCNANETASLHAVVDALAVGSADLVVSRADASTFDSVTLQIESAAKLSLLCADHSSAVTVANGSLSAVDWQPVDSIGKPLMASAGVTLTSSDANVAAFQQLIGSPVAQLAATKNWLFVPSLVATGPGTATLTGTGGGVTESIVVTVTP